MVVVEANTLSTLIKTEGQFRRLGDMMGLGLIAIYNFGVELHG